MSPPTKALADLSLDGNMPGRSRKASRRQQRLEPDSEQSSHSPTNGVIEAASGITYDITELGDGKSQSRAEVGFRNVDVKLNQASSKGEDEERYFAFEFTDQFSIRVGDTNSAHATPNCTCGANEDDQPCKVSLLHNMFKCASYPCLSKC